MCRVVLEDVDGKNDDGGVGFGFLYCVRDVVVYGHVHCGVDGFYAVCRVQPVKSSKKHM